MTKPLARVFAALLLTGGLAGAQAAPCAPDLLSNYLLGGAACEAGGVTLSGFSVEPFPSASADIDPATLTLVPVGNGFDLVSANPIAAAANELLGLRLLFQVTAPALAGGSVELDSSAAVTGDGAISGLLSAGPTTNAIALVLDGLAVPMDSFVATASFFDIFFELGIDGGPSGNALLGPLLASLRFDVDGAAVPEPAPWGLLALGAIGLAAARRRTTPAA